jgi:hypothetical protein
MPKMSRSSRPHVPAFVVFTLTPYRRVNASCCAVELLECNDVPTGAARRKLIGALAGPKVANVPAKVDRCVLLNSAFVSDDHRRHGSVGFDRAQTIGCDGKPNAVAGNRILGSDFNGPSEETGQDVSDQGTTRKQDLVFKLDAMKGLAEGNAEYLDDVAVVVELNPTGVDRSTDGFRRRVGHPSQAIHGYRSTFGQQRKGMFQDVRVGYGPASCEMLDRSDELRPEGGVGQGSFLQIGHGFSLEVHSVPAWIGGHFTVAYEQNTQQSPCFGFNREPQPSHT